jgi:hypothetical protein
VTRVARVLALALAVAGCGAPNGVGVSGAWARSTPEGATVAAVYVTLRSAMGDTLLGVSVPADVAREAQLHEVVRDAAGRLGMHELARLPLPAGRDVSMQPGGMHVMLVGVARPLAPGGTITLTLRFARAGTLVQRVPVRES